MKKTRFMSLVVSDNLINGKKIELSDITANQFFLFGYIDNAKRVTITMPEKFWSFEVVGFSQNINISVSYDGTTWSKANKSSGTIDIQFTNYNNCEFYYSGPYKVIQ